MKIDRLILMAFVVMAPAMTIHAKTLRALKTSSAGSSIEFIADSIEYRPDVTRLYGKLKGRPHTSNRIDVIRGKFGKITYGSTDIDGVDMKRWFQWEDEGLIPVEIDFPIMKDQNTFAIELEGPKGNSIWKIATTTSDCGSLNKKR